MRAFHNDTAIQQKYLARAERHRRHDQLIQGFYWLRLGEGKHGMKGCAVGCLAHTSDNPHLKLEEELDIPENFWLIVDSIFEDLKPEDAQEWPETILAAIPLGADLSDIYDRWDKAITSANYLTHMDYRGAAKASLLLSLLFALR